jgi:hypothetical protein
MDIRTIIRVDPETQVPLPMAIYGNSRQGSRIIHAKTGFPMEGIFGTYDEDRFFRMMYSVGDQRPHYNEPVILFYFSPQEAEQHLKMRISNETKNRFEQKFQN